MYEIAEGQFEVVLCEEKIQLGKVHAQNGFGQRGVDYDAGELRIVVQRQNVLDYLDENPEHLLLVVDHSQQFPGDEVHALAVAYTRIADGKARQHVS